MKNILSKIIRIITIPPILALGTFIIFYVHKVGIKNLRDFLLAVFTISLLPVIAYIVHKYVEKHVKYFEGREGQRKMAIFFSVAGYVIGLIVNVLIEPNKVLTTVYLGYLFSGIMILVSSFIGFKLSGHAVGTAGPVALLFTFGLKEWIIGLFLMIPVFLSSLKMKRHTTFELLAGFLFPFALLPVINLLLNRFDFFA